MSDDEPVPCPFCASVDPFVGRQLGPGEHDWWVECLWCGARGPSGGDAAHAIRRWNRRTKPSDIDGEIQDERDESDMKGHCE